MKFDKFKTYLAEEVPAYTTQWTISVKDREGMDVIESILNNTIIDLNTEDIKFLSRPADEFGMKIYVIGFNDLENFKEITDLLPDSISQDKYIYPRDGEKFELNA